MVFRTSFAAFLAACVMHSSIASAADEIVMPTRGICAHRGANVTHPENTLAAFREAIRLGAHQIEFDIQWSKDGHIVVMHDATVDRTTDGKGRVADLTFAEIQALDAGVRKGPQFKGERVPTLGEALAVMPVNIWINVHTRNDPALAEAAAREIMRQNRTHQAFLAIGQAGADAARRVCPGILICNMQRRGNDVPRYAAETIARRDAFLQLLRGPGVQWPKEFDAMKQAGVRINYFGTNDPDSLAALYESGVDFPLVDDVAPMMDAARRLGIAPWKPAYRQQ